MGNLSYKLKFTQVKKEDFSEGARALRRVKSL